MADRRRDLEPTPAQLSILQRGMGLQQQRRFVEAEFCYQSVLRDSPRNPDALNLMGTLAIEAARLPDAIGYFRRALKLLPRQPMYLNNLGTAHLESGDYARALEQFRKAIDADPRFADALCNLGRTQKLLNRSAEALDAYERAYRLNPDSAKAMVGLGDVLVDLGDMNRATSLFRAAIAIGGDQTAPALIGLSTARRFAPGDPEPQQMLDLLAGPILDERVRASLHHAAGKALADLKSYDAAFAQFAAAKAITGRGYDLEALRASHDRLMALLTPEFFAARQSFGVSSEVPIFIVGMPRSGTTLTEQIIASHSEVGGAGELSAIGDIAAKLGAQAADPELYVRNLAAMTPGQSRDHAKQYLGELKRFGSGRRITDKMPHNFEALGLIALLFPKARVIHCQRDPIDTCVSCFTHHFAASHGYNGDLETLGRYYREYERLMAHWHAVLPVAMLESRYEELIAEQEKRTRELIGFLNLDWEDACLDFHTSERIVKTPSRWQVRQPIYTSSVAGWKRYEAHLGPLLAALSAGSGASR